jgi:simple sugar transport system substrate-binding protein
LTRKSKANVDPGRRRFLGASTAAAAGIAAAGIVGGVGGYFVGGSGGGRTTQTITQPGQITTQTVTNTVTSTSTVTAPTDRRFKASFVYVGPIGDFGWTFQHNAGRLYAEERLPWLETDFLESVPEPESGPVMDTLVEQGANMIFTTSFGFMDPTAEAAARHPNVLFEHCSGFRSGAAGNATSNMGSYFAEFYQLYYLNGIAAGAVNQTGVVGYVAAFPIPEVIRHINAFVMGARSVNPEIRAEVKWLFSWFDPAKNREATTSLVEDNNADVIAFTEDTPTALQVAEEYQTQKNRKVWSFSHYGNMQQYGPTAHLTGQIVNWGPIYTDLISRAYSGAWTSLDIWTKAGDYDPLPWRKTAPDPSRIGTPEGTVYPAPLSPAIPDAYRAQIAALWEDMKEGLFEPFTGPIRDQEGQVRLQDGQRATHDDLWTMDWFVEGIETTLPTS